MFSKSQQKRQVLGDLRVYRVWPEKNSFADTFGLFCLFADPDPNQMKGVYMFDLH